VPESIKLKSRKNAAIFFEYSMLQSTHKKNNGS